MQTYSAKAPVGQGEGMQRGADLLRRTAVFVEPLVFNNSLHSHSRDELRQCVLPCDALNGFLNVEKRVSLCWFGYRDWESVPAKIKT